MVNQSIKIGLTNDNETVFMPVCSVISVFLLVVVENMVNYTLTIEIDKNTHRLNAF